MNFDAISKNVKIVQIGPVEPKLWKIREITLLKNHAGRKNHSLPHGMREEMYQWSHLAILGRENSYTSGVAASIGI